MTSEKLKVMSAFCIPSRLEFLACSMKWAVLINALEGTHPVLRQSPPILCFSMRATRAFTAAPT